MTLSRASRALLLAFTALVLLVVYAPLALVVLNSFNASKSFAWPGCTTTCCANGPTCDLDGRLTDSGDATRVAVRQSNTPRRRPITQHRVGFYAAFHNR